MFADFCGVKPLIMADSIYQCITKYRVGGRYAEHTTENCPHCTAVVDVNNVKSTGNSKMRKIIKNT